LSELKTSSAPRSRASLSFASSTSTAILRVNAMFH
jgi:hypothetical protein